MEIDKVKNSKNSSDEDKCWSVKLLDNKVHYKATIIQTTLYLQEDILKWQPTPVFLPGESHGQRSLVGYSPRGQRVRHD